MTKPIDALDDLNLAVAAGRVKQVWVYRLLRLQGAEPTQDWDVVARVYTDQINEGVRDAPCALTLTGTRP